jgi:hypothetical protein
MFINFGLSGLGGMEAQNVFSIYANHVDLRVKENDVGVSGDRGRRF